MQNKRPKHNQHDLGADFFTLTLITKYLYFVADLESDVDLKIPEHKLYRVEQEGSLVTMGTRVCPSHTHPNIYL